MTEPFPHAYPAEPEGVAAPQQERVVLGLLAALVAVVAGIVLTVLVWRAGFVAGITSFVIAIGASFLYTLAAGRPPRRGLIPLIVLILIGVALSFFAVVASDLADFYDDAIAAGGQAPMGKAEFIRRGLTDGDILGAYKKDILWFAGFAALGIYGTIRRMVASR